jgi:arylsulfatase A-like enzyme
VAQDKPNILVIWGDDIGITNLSCYSDGLMGYRTPNIDGLADEGMRFTDSYGEQSCTTGRSSFITGQSVFPPRQKAASFTIDQAVAKLEAPLTSGH